MDSGAERAVAIELAQNVRGVKSVQSKALTLWVGEASLKGRRAPVRDRSAAAGHRYYIQRGSPAQERTTLSIVWG